MRSHLPLRRLFVEHLENRSVLAGNVLAELVDGTLFITGDEFDNSVSIVDIGDGVTVAGFGQTSINGGTEPVEFGGVARIEVVGNDGHDTIVGTLGSEATVGEVRIDTGAGRDLVDLFTSSGSDLVIDTGDGADLASVRSFSGYGGGGNLQIATEDGRDQVFLFLYYHVGEVQVDTGSGNDDVYANVEEVVGDLSIATGNGSDTVFLDAEFHSVHDGDLTVDGGNGVDTLHYNPDLNFFLGEEDPLNIELYDLS